MCLDMSSKQKILIQWTSAFAKWAIQPKICIPQMVHYLFPYSLHCKSNDIPRKPGVYDVDSKMQTLETWQLCGPQHGNSFWFKNTYWVKLKSKTFSSSVFTKGHRLDNQHLWTYVPVLSIHGNKMNQPNKWYIQSSISKNILIISKLSNQVPELCNRQLFEYFSLNFAFYDWKNKRHDIWNTKEYRDHALLWQQSTALWSLKSHVPTSGSYTHMRECNERISWERSTVFTHTRYCCCSQLVIRYNACDIDTAGSWHDLFIFKRRWICQREQRLDTTSTALFQDWGIIFTQPSGMIPNHPLCDMSQGG